MSTLYCAKQSYAMANYSYEPDAEEGTEALRRECETGVLGDEVFWQWGVLPERMKAAFMKALRSGDAEANDREVARIMRAAFNRAVNEALEMRLARIEAEAMINFHEEI